MKEKIRLSLGTIVKLNSGNVKVSIIGHEHTMPSSNTTFHYLGIDYPIGLTPNSEMVFFNDEDIELIFRSGYVDEDHIAFSRALDMDKSEEMEQLSQKSSFTDMEEL